MLRFKWYFSILEKRAQRGQTLSNDNPAHKLQQAIDKLKFLIKHLSPNLYVHKPS
jgi:hypothetical protein